MPRAHLTRLPSMSSLLGFEAVARTRSIAGAARELYLTPGAVSKQLRELEQQLGCPLVARTTRSVQLTAEGVAFQRAIAPLLAGLEEATLMLRARSVSDTRLEVGVPHSLGNRWLIPRLASFFDAHPQVSLNLTTISGVPDLSGSALHCALCYCAKPPAGHVGERVMGLRLYPYIAARLAGTRRTDARELLRRHPLLEQATLPDMWPQLLRKLGIDATDVRFGARYQLLTLGLQAALSGLGIALLPAYVAQPDLEAGRISRVGDDWLDTGASYQLIRLKGRERSVAMTAFTTWVRQQGRLADETR